MESEKAEIAELAAKYGRVQSLMRYVNKETLAKSYSRQPKGKAVGVDGVTKETYGENLNENLDDLLKRMKQFSYRPYPVRRAYIPKGNGKMRGLGIPSFEDKVVQGVFKEILEGIYEPKFLDFSYGFRPNRSCHDAIQRVNKHIMADKVNYSSHEMKTEYLTRKASYFWGNIYSSGESVIQKGTLYWVAPTRYNYGYENELEIEEHFEFVKRISSAMKAPTLMAENTVEYKAMINDLDLIADEARTVCGDISWKVHAESKQYQFDYMETLPEYVPNLLAEEPFFRNVFPAA